MLGDKPKCQNPRKSTAWFPEKPKHYLNGVTGDESQALQSVPDPVRTVPDPIRGSFRPSWSGACDLIRGAVASDRSRLAAPCYNLSNNSRRFPLRGQGYVAQSAGISRRDFRRFQSLARTRRFDIEACVACWDADSAFLLTSSNLSLAQPSFRWPSKSHHSGWSSPWQLAESGRPVLFSPPLHARHVLLALPHCFVEQAAFPASKEIGTLDAISTLGKHNLKTHVLRGAETAATT